MDPGATGKPCCCGCAELGRARRKTAIRNPKNLFTARLDRTLPGILLPFSVDASGKCSLAHLSGCVDQLTGPLVYNCAMSFRPSPGNPNAKRSRTPPPEETFEEATFLKLLGEKQKSVSVKLMDGQVFRGWIEYYDKNMIRLTREGEPNLFIFKHEIMYIAEDGGKRK
jgi:host factor-I protein